MAGVADGDGQVGTSVVDHMVHRAPGAVGLEIDLFSAVRPLEAMELRLPLGRSVQMCQILSPLAVSPRGPSR